VLICQAAAQDQALREAARLDSEQKCGEAERIQPGIYEPFFGPCKNQ